MEKHKLSIIVLLAILFLWTPGCRTTGYIVRVETPTIAYGAIEQMEFQLSERGYSMVEKEKKRYEGAPENDLTTVFEKRFDAPELWRHGVSVSLFYVKGDNAQKLRIDIYNHFVGLVVPEIKEEIDSIGDLIYRIAAEEVGSANVHVSRIKWGPPAGI